VDKWDNSARWRDLRVFHFEQTNSTMRDRIYRSDRLSKTTAHKGLPVEYRGIRYTVRARIERNEWAVSIHPAGIEGARRVVTGPRERAELLVRSMIDRWNERAQRGAVNLYNRKARRIAANVAKLPELVQKI
jgi:hypothetical protein